MTREPASGWDWLDDDGVSSENTGVEVLETGSGSRHTRFVPPLARRAAMVLIALAVAVAAARQLLIRPSQDAREGAPLHRVVVPVNTVHTGATQSGAIQAVLALAHVHGQGHDYVRQTSPPRACAVVPMNRSPVRRITEALQRVLDDPPSALRFGRTLDEYTALCSVDMRARYNQAVLTLSISAPGNGKHLWQFARLETGIVTDQSTTTEYALSISRTGWRVLVGATGPEASLPGSGELLSIAQDPHLPW